MIEKILFAASLNNVFNTFIHFSNITYYHFYFNEIPMLSFQQHFIIYEGQTYYCTNFYNDNMISNLKQSSEIINDKIQLFEKQINIKKGIILYVTTKSVGHEMASILNAIYHYRLNHLEEYDVIISDKIFSLGNFLLSLIYLFIHRDKIHFIDNKTKVIIEETYIYKSIPHKEDITINFLLDELSKYRVYGQKSNKCMIKHIDEKSNYNTPSNGFNKDYIDFFVEQGFTFIKPEEYNIIDLYNELQNSDKLIMSWGCNSWVNSIFVTQNQHVMILCHNGYKQEYKHVRDKEESDNKIIKTNWTPDCEKVIMIYDL